MKKLKKSTWLTVVLLLYVTGTAIYLLPKNQEMGDTEKWVPLGGAYVIVLLLWWVLRKKEAYKKRREEDMNQNK
ncbi:MAG: hypothetical protein LUD15_01985 [Bacteroides sp.]|nr:hypothetical protein [Bacteroides sp.]